MAKMTLTTKVVVPKRSHLEYDQVQRSLSERAQVMSLSPTQVVGETLLEVSRCVHDLHLLDVVFQLFFLEFYSVRRGLLP